MMTISFGSCEKKVIHHLEVAYSFIFTKFSHHLVNGFITKINMTKVVTTVDSQNLDSLPLLNEL